MYNDWTPLPTQPHPTPIYSSVNFKAHIPLGIVFPLATQQHEIYMANARILRWGPNVTYIFHLLALRLALGVTQILAFLDTNLLVCLT